MLYFFKIFGNKKKRSVNYIFFENMLIILYKIKWITLLNKTTNEVKEEVKEILKHGTDILAPSCGIAPKTPLENIKAFVEARNEYYLEKN